MDLFNFIFETATMSHDCPQVHGYCSVDQGCPTKTKFGLLSFPFSKFAKQNLKLKLDDK